MNVFTPPPILQKCFFLIGNLMLFQIKKCLHQFSIAKLVKIQDGRQFYKKYMIFKKIAKSFFAKEKNTKIWANVILYMFFDMRNPFMVLKNNFDQCKWQKIQDGRQNLAFCRFFWHILFCGFYTNYVKVMKPLYIYQTICIPSDGICY